MTFIPPGSVTAANGTWLPPGVGPGSVTANGVTNQNASSYIASNASIPADGAPHGITTAPVQPPGTYLVMGQATFSGATVSGEADLYIYCGGMGANFLSASTTLVNGQINQLEISGIIVAPVATAFQLVVTAAAAITGNITALAAGANSGRTGVTGLVVVRIA